MKDQHWLFCKAFAGSQGGRSKDEHVIFAMNEAGYEGADLSKKISGYRLLRRTDVQDTLIYLARGQMMATPAVVGEPEEVKAIVAKYTTVADLGELGTWEGRASVLARIANDDDAKDSDRLQAIKLLGQMHGDYIARKRIELPDGPVVQTTTIHITQEDAKEIARGRKQLSNGQEEARGEGRRRHPSGGGDVIDVLVGEQAPVDQSVRDGT